MQIKIPVPFDCPTNLSHHLKHVFEGEYEVPLYAPGLTILDVGANVGSFSIWAAHRFPHSTIHSYEPHPKNYELLVKNCRRYPNIKTYECGVGIPGTRILYNGKHNDGEHSLIAGCRGVDGMTGQHVTVIDPLSMPKADIIKMDTEGCEIEILRPLILDMQSFLAVMFEYHAANHRTELESLLGKDYVLVGADIYSPSRGTMKFLHKKLVEGL